MDCQKFARMLDDYENLSDGEKADMEVHSNTCPECRRELLFMRSITDTAKTLPRLDVPDNFLAVLNQRIDASEKNKVVTHLRHNWRRYSAAAASLALAAVIGSNYDMLLNRMQNDDDGVIETVTYTAEPDTAAYMDLSQETADAENTENNDIVSNVTENSTAVYQREMKEPSRIYNSSAAENSSVAANPTETVRPAETEANVQSTDASDAVSGIEFIETGVPVAEASNEPVKEAVTDEPVYNGYEIDSSRESMGYAMAVNSGGVDTVNKNDGYTIYADGLLIIPEEDYREAMDIIIRYVTGIYNSYYFINTSSLGDMRAELYDAGIGFEDYISATSEEITFRIIVR